MLMSTKLLNKIGLPKYYCVTKILLRYQNTVKVSHFGCLSHRSAHISHIFYMRKVISGGESQTPKMRNFTVVLFQNSCH